MKMQFVVTKNLRLVNSYGTIDQEKDVEVEVTLGIRDDDPTRGWFEFYDKDSGGENWYAEGGLWFNDKKELVDYDGVFSLPNFIEDKLKDLNYKIKIS
jgi:hypothetical protein